MTRMTERHDPPMCLRCFGTGVDPIIDDVTCWECDGTGNERRAAEPVVITPDILRRIALGEFRRRSP